MRLTLPNRGIRAASSVLLLVAVSCLGWRLVCSQETPSATPKAAKKKAAQPAERKGQLSLRQALGEPAVEATLKGKWSIEDATMQRDFPVMCLDGEGVPWIAFIENDGAADVLKLARKTQNGIEAVSAISEPGIIHQPAIACDGKDALWCVWGQVGADDVVHLQVRRRSENGEWGPIDVLAKSAGSDTFADARADHAGRVWVAWQSMRRGQGDVYVRWRDSSADDWSPEIRVSAPSGGNWEPRLAFDGTDGAWVVYDGSRGGEFNLYLARVHLDGKIQEKQITHSPDYEARASIQSDGGKGLWIAAERGRKNWGRDLRGHEAQTGLNGEKRLLFGRFDIATGMFTEHPLPAGNSPGARKHDSVNLPVVGLDSAGNPWLAYRAFTALHWRINLIRFDKEKRLWSQAVELPDSAFGQDRRAVWQTDPMGQSWLCWPSDRRPGKACGVAAVFLAQVDTSPLSPAGKAEGAVKLAQQSKPYLNETTPERARTDLHTWAFGGEDYRLCFGDLHRHTEFSNCRTATDGCVNEHFRYAIDMAALDFVGTSDHTDIAKKYDPYEWWQTQRMVDVFHVPGVFAPLYAYEREQRFPWGHRNIIFAQRGGPIIYINRPVYQDSPWQKMYPCPDGDVEITPMELWGLLRAYGKPVSAISHTGATGMGTDWDRYERIDHAVENIVEIYQGARVSYEGLGAPQPTVGLKQGDAYTVNAAADLKPAPPPAPIEEFGDQFRNGVYQRSLQNGHQLGVFASSDHISTHTSFGGAYVKEFTREGIIEAFNARRTIAATDKIFVEFSCNGKPLGSVFESAEPPDLSLAVFGTAPIKRVTIVRNEANWKSFEPGAAEFRKSIADESPLAGENRYYIRVEQVDGNMAWSSPVWVTMKK